LFWRVPCKGCAGAYPQQTEKDNQPEMILTSEQEEELLKYYNDSMRTGVIVALNTGKKRGEILALR
jgi:hypothetical protein